MNRYQLEPPEILRYEEVADDSVCFHIKKPYGVLIGAVTRYRVRWKNCASGEEFTRLYESPNATRLEVVGLRNGQTYEFHFESGSRVRFGKSTSFGKITLQNWNDRTLSERMSDCKTLIGRLGEWAESTSIEITEKVFNENKIKLFKRRSSIFSRFSNPVKFNTKLSSGVYLAFVGIHENEVLTTMDNVLPLIRVDKLTTTVGDALMKWICRLPRAYRDLVAFQRMNEECTLNEPNEGGYSIEREIVRNLLSVLSLTCYPKVDFFHFRPLVHDDATVIVAGALGASEFIEGLQWSPIDSIGEGKLQMELIAIGRFYEQMHKRLQPGLYVADFRLVSDVRQICVKTDAERPAFLPCSFVRPNSHMTATEWSWLKMSAVENTTENPNADQLDFYRKFFPAVEELLERSGSADQQAEYCIYNDFLLEYGPFSMILASRPVLQINCLSLEYLRQVSPVVFEKYCKVRAFIPVFKEVMKTAKINEKRFRNWQSSVQQNIADAEKMLSKFDADVCWLNKVVSNARKAGPHSTKLSDLQQKFELLGILCYTPTFLGLKSKLTRISVVITFPSLYPVGTTMLIQLKSETTAAEVAQLMMQRCFTKPQLKQLSADDFYVAVLYGARERRLRNSFQIAALDEPWIDGEFCLKCCLAQDVISRMISVS
ncbi:Ankyrin repeat and fibronectin type-III domain-containing protein 1 isoform X4 [Aphelenchoides fujianensis]|nr:Ankyrin repeat and fibronectin type-III domain-containing protein 1 isoform X4 [Aphelenchoides fujianensis]